MDTTPTENNSESDPNKDAQNPVSQSPLGVQPQTPNNIQPADLTPKEAPVSNTEPSASVGNSTSSLPQAESVPIIPPAPTVVGAVPVVTAAPPIVQTPTVSGYVGTFGQSQPVASVAASAQDAQAPPASKKSSASAGVVVLQWVTYAFWLWASLSIIALIASVITQLIISDAETGTFSLYALSASLVLLPVAGLCDFFYSKKEEPHKRGASAAVMLIHAVIFALYGVGSLISMVFAFITLIINSGSAQPIIVWLITSLLAACIYAVLFGRVALVNKFPILRRILLIMMAALAVVFTIAAFVGPVASMVKTKDDKLIMDNIDGVARGVSNYVSKNNKLPASLDDIDADGDANVLIERNLVVYTPGQTTTDSSSSYSSSSYSRYGSMLSTKYNFTLCVTYKDEYKPSNTYSRYKDADGSQPATSLYVSSHGKGQECYKLYANGSSNLYNN